MTSCTRFAKLSTSAVFLLAACGGQAPAARVAARTVRRAAAAEDEIATLRRVTAAYHVLGNALAAGYVESTRACTDAVAGDTQFFTAPDLGAPGVSADDPEVLEYAPSPDAADGFRLVAVTYLEYLYWPDLTVPRPPPVLFGQTFSGPFGSVKGRGPFWALRVWLQGNPDGEFAFTNPNVSCDLPGGSGSAP